MDAHGLVEPFEATTLPLETWTQRGYLTAAWTYLERHGLEGASGHVRGHPALQRGPRTAEALDRGCHETLTRAWLRVVHAVRTIHGAAESAAGFLEAQPFLLDRLLLRLDFSRPRMMSGEAKRGFVEPDLAPFPAPPAGAL